MKKLFIYTAMALLLIFPSAFADEHGGKNGMFGKHDTNGDGTISKAEFLSHAEERFAKMDANGDGSISKEEGKAAREDRRSNMKERMKQRKEKRASEE